MPWKQKLLGLSTGNKQTRTTQKVMWAVCSWCSLFSCWLLEWLTFDAESFVRNIFWADSSWEPPDQMVMPETIKLCFTFPKSSFLLAERHRNCLKFSNPYSWEVTKFCTGAQVKWLPCFEKRKWVGGMTVVSKLMNRSCSKEGRYHPSFLLGMGRLEMIWNGRKQGTQ